MAQAYKICTRCIMDATDPDITFDSDGVCSHCRHYEMAIKDREYLTNRHPDALTRLIYNIKKEGAGRPHDCIVGLSGGVDSTYMVYLAKKFGLRPLVVHIDNGWNSELSVHNIEKILKRMDIDIYSYVLDWEEFKSLQLAFLKSSVPGCEIPTDHAIAGGLYLVAHRKNIKYILTGQNIATECGGVPAWSRGHRDWRYIKSINNIFGTGRLAAFPYLSVSRSMYYRIIRRIKWVMLLNYVDYDKKQALSVLHNEFGWKHYGNKHYESLYTKFFMGYILPKKFGIDYRKLHLSALIWSGQMSRQEALEEMALSSYSERMQEDDKQFVIKKLGITTEEFERIMALPIKTFWDYPSYTKIRSRIYSIWEALFSKRKQRYAY